MTTTRKKPLDPHTLRWAARQLRREAKALDGLADEQRDMGYTAVAEDLRACAVELKHSASVLLWKARTLEQKPRKR